MDKNYFFKYSPEFYFDFKNYKYEKFFREKNFIWELIKLIPDFIQTAIQPDIKGEVEQGAWLEPGKVELGDGSFVERGAIVRGPAIIGKNTRIRSGAYIRGDVMVGDNCLVGKGTELRQTVIMNNSNVPHQNCIFTSILGNNVNVGGASSAANFRLDGKEVILKLPDKDSVIQKINSELVLFGAIIGDNSKVGGQVLICPGTIIGKNCFIYPNCVISNYIPHDSCVKYKEIPLEIIPRKS